MARLVFLADCVPKNCTQYYMIIYVLSCLEIILVFNALLSFFEGFLKAEVALGITLSLFHALQTSHVLSILPRNLNQKGNECQNKICPDNKNRVNGNPSNQWETDDKLCASFS